MTNETVLSRLQHHMLFTGNFSVPYFFLLFWGPIFIIDVLGFFSNSYNELHGENNYRCETYVQILHLPSIYMYKTNQRKSHLWKLQWFVQKSNVLNTMTYMYMKPTAMNFKTFVEVILLIIIIAAHSSARCPGVETY